jgi:hypothetical protein
MRQGDLGPIVSGVENGSEAVPKSFLTATDEASSLDGSLTAGH